MIPWNNLFLIPLVLIGGIVAYAFAGPIVGKLFRKVSSIGREAPIPAPIPSSVAPVNPMVQEAYIEPDVYRKPRRTIELPEPRKKSFAERQEELIESLLLADNRQKAIDYSLKQQDEEEVRRMQLVEEARKRAKSTNVLVGKLDVPATAGPLTTHISLTKDLLAQLEAAAAKRDAVKV